jgi:hypothetical protein
MTDHFTETKMNIKTKNAAPASLEVLSNTRQPLVRETSARAGQLLFGLVKFLTVSAPFLSMVMMILALWGVVGKASYPDLDAARQAAASDAGKAEEAKEAKNYLVNETKIIEQCSEAVQSPDNGPDEETPKPGKIDWEHVV